VSCEKNGWIDQDVLFDVDLGGTKEACVRWRCTLVQPGNWTMRWRCGLFVNCSYCVAIANILIMLLLWRTGNIILMLYCWVTFETFQLSYIGHKAVLFRMFRFSCANTVILFRLTLMLLGCIAVLRVSVCHTSDPCRNGCTDRDAVWVEDLGWPREPCVRWGSRSVGRANFQGVRLQSIGTLCGHLCKDGWTDWDAVWVGLGWAQGIMS